MGLAESAGVQLAHGRPVSFVLGGLYGVALALVMAAVLAMALAGEAFTGRRRWLRRLGAFEGAVLLVRAVGVEVLLLSDATYGDGAISKSERFWTLVLWNPWFLVGGLASGLAAVAARRSAVGPSS